MTDSQYYERVLTPLEIKQRTDQTLDLMRELDDLRTDVDDRRREIRNLTASRKKLEARISQYRREIHSGRVLEPRQLEIALEQPTPGEPQSDKFDELYPLARTHAALRDYLQDALSDKQYSKLTEGTVENWHLDSGIFHGVASWARLEKAHRDVRGREPIGGLHLPRKQPMPAMLKELLGGKAAPKKRGRKPGTARRAPAPERDA